MTRPAQIAFCVFSFALGMALGVAILAVQP